MDGNIKPTNTQSLIYDSYAGAWLQQSRPSRSPSHHREVPNLGCGKSQSSGTSEGICCEHSNAIVETNLNLVPMSGGEALAPRVTQKQPFLGELLEPVTPPKNPGSQSKSNTKETINFFQNIINKTTSKDVDNTTTNANTEKNLKLKSFKKHS